MTSSLVPLGPLRPEVPALVAAIDTAMDHIDTRGHRGRVVVLDLGMAQDLLDTIENLCIDHRRCEACGETVACHTCSVGDLATIDDWCLHLGLCPGCRYRGCAECRTGAA